jgi:poly(A) polymerase
LLRLLVAPGRAAGVRLLRQTGLLAAMLPEVASLAGRPGPFGTTSDALEFACSVLGQLQRPTALLAFAGLVHAFDPDAVRSLCRRLRFPAAESRTIADLLRRLPGLYDIERMTRAGVRRRLLFPPGGADVIELHRAILAASSRDPSTFYLAAEAIAASPPGGARERALDGDDLIALGYRPGPGFARILRALEDAWDRGEVQTSADARAWVLARFPVQAGPAGGSPEPSGRHD